MKLGPSTLAFLVLISFSAFNCKSSTEPEDKKALPDSTSQDFTFEIKRFGKPGPSSAFEDVWIFDENNIWTVGDVFLDEASGPEYGTEYNIMQWNGKEWKGRGELFNSSGIYGIWALDTGRVYLSPGIALVYKNGQYKWADFSKMGFENWDSMDKIWTSSEDNVWGVGHWGIIMHYDGKDWKRIAFDKQWYFYSITGSNTTGVAYALARNSDHIMIIVKLQNSTAEVIYKSESQYTQYSGWTLTLANEKDLYIGYGPIWKFNVETKTKQVVFTPSSGTSIGASFAVSPIDIYFYGMNWTTDVMIHYNGKRFKEFALPSRSDINGGIKATSNIAAAVSFTNNQAQIITIKRK
ncbi:MAG: hypothetical protein ACM3QX_17655 [Syntrophomonadaceae bacterium]